MPVSVRASRPLGSDVLILTEGPSLRAAIRDAAGEDQGSPRAMTGVCWRATPEILSALTSGGRGEAGESDVVVRGQSDSESSPRTSTSDDQRRAEPSHSDLCLLARQHQSLAIAAPLPSSEVAAWLAQRAAISSQCVRAAAARSQVPSDLFYSNAGCPPTASSRFPTSCSTASLSWLRSASFAPSVSATRYSTRCVL